MLWLALSVLIGGVMYACLHMAGEETRREERERRAFKD